MGKIMDGSRREKLTRLALNPDTKQLDLQVVIRDQRIQGILDRGNKADAYTAAYTLSETLKNPDAIFEGLKRDDDEPRGSDTSSGWLCYVHRPARRYNDKGGADATPNGWLFLAFVNDDQIVYNWTWEKADTNALTRGEYLPDDYEHRFAKRVY